MSVVVWVVVALLVCGLISGSMAQNRGNAYLPYFAFGCLLGVLGIFLAAVARPPLPTDVKRPEARPTVREPREPRTKAERRIAERFSEDY